MTSEHTKDATETFFRNHNFFGLRPENVILFEQGLLPCLTLDGKIILETPSKVALSPGNTNTIILYLLVISRGSLLTESCV